MRRPVQELAYAMCTAIAVLDAVRDSGQVQPGDFGEVVERISFFVNAGVRFVEEMCKMRAFGRLWDELLAQRYGVTDERQRRFRYGVQVNSLGLTEAQPENNVQRIVLEMLGVTLSQDARARAVQLPAWNEALGLPRARGTSSGRCACSRCWRSSPTCSSTTTCSRARSSSRRAPTSWCGGPRGDRPRPGDGRRGRGRRERLHEVPAGRLARGPAGPDRDRATTSSSASTRSRPTEPNPLLADAAGCDPDGRPGGRGSRRSPSCAPGGPPATPAAVDARPRRAAARPRQPARRT